MMMNLTIVCDELRLKRDLQLLDLYIHTIMQASMWTQFANYFYRNIPVEWRLAANSLEPNPFRCSFAIIP